MTQLRKLLCGFAAAVLILAASFAHAANEIVIGFTGPLSGPAAEYGQDCVNGVDMAIKEINAAGGVMADGQKYLFRLEKMDDQVNPTRTVANARELLDKGALAIYNPVFGTAASLLAINEEECGEFILLAYTSSSKADEIKNDASFVDDLGADSLDTVELVMALEDEFETEIPDEEAEKITTVQQAIDYVKSHSKA